MPLPEPLVDIDAVSTYLDVPVSTIRKWVLNGTGPKPHKIGRVLRWDVDEVRRWATSDDDDTPEPRRFTVDQWLDALDAAVDAGLGPYNGQPFASFAERLAGALKCEHTAWRRASQSNMRNTPRWECVSCECTADLVVALGETVLLQCGHEVAAVDLDDEVAEHFGEQGCEFSAPYAA